MAAHGGFIGNPNLTAYRAVERTPVKASTAGDILSAPPPVGGMTVVEVLQILATWTCRSTRTCRPATSISLPRR
jgi:gamma-glutamyltranspeptidase